MPIYITFLLCIFSLTTPSNYATEKAGAVTPFKQAWQYGTLGIIAHNYLAGEHFSELKQGDQIILIYADRHIEKYVVSKFERYIALQPFSVYSDFVPDGGGKKLSAANLFLKIYDPDDRRIVLQTCYDGYNGRLLIIAYPEKEKAPEEFSKGNMK